ncbi:hypothetical protein NQ317_004441 [Molorchus minor]|uniref:Uncharacterized protein n=1 Tax=Molorchus minor TaxID=1323400 RepID=A0ABQ9JCD3_9CUCU|nr:hypothetical protein NQ317_004441 [Molorchus minor]
MKTWQVGQIAPLYFTPTAPYLPHHLYTVSNETFPTSWILFLPITAPWQQKYIQIKPFLNLVLRYLLAYINIKCRTALPDHCATSRTAYY